MAGCTNRHYRQSADKEVYRIIEQVEGQIFGRTNGFTIDTAYSPRDPQEILPLELIEDRMATNHRVINLTAALDLGVQHSREFQTQKEQLYLSTLSLTGARYEFTPRFFANSTASLTGVGGDLQTGSVRSRVGVNQVLRTGGSLSASLANDVIRYYTGNAPGGGRHSIINTLSVNLAQPLLRGFGRNDPAVENLTQAERNVVYAIRSFSQYQKQFSVDIVNDYFSLLGQKNIVRNNYTNYLRRVDSTKYLEARAVDRQRRTDVDDARTSELNARIGYINSLAAYLSQLDSFKIRLGLPLNEAVFLDDADLDQLEASGLIAVDVDRNAGFRLAVQRHMDLLNAIDRFEDSKRKIRLAADQLRPGLTVFGNASLASDEPDDYTNFDLNNIRYTAGIELDLPIDRLRQRNTYRAALISFESQLRSLTLTFDNFKDRIDRGLRTLEQQRLNYLSREAALEVAERRVDMNQLLLQAGRLQFINLRDSYDDLIEAQNALTTVKVTYLQARLRLLLDLGVITTDLDHFWLHDPLEGEIDDSQRGPSPLEMPDDILIPPDHFLEARHESLPTS